MPKDRDDLLRIALIEAAERLVVEPDLRVERGRRWLAWELSGEAHPVNRRS